MKIYYEILSQDVGDLGEWCGQWQDDQREIC
jgi:hypothetical protein